MNLRSMMKRDATPVTEDMMEEGPYCSTCRPCCTIPFGKLSLATAVLVTVAWIFSVFSMAGCHFMHAEFEYCVPPPATFGTCGDCHCIRGADECPTGVSIPTIDFSQETVDQWKAIKHSNPLQLGCNPYKNTTCDTVPSQEYVELWETAVCAVKYNDTTLDSDQCPAEYATVSYPSEEAAKQDGAFITHYGTCGVCSSLQDLAVYVEYPDLTGAGQECGIVGTFDNQAGIDCFVNIGYTPTCAEMWMYNVHQTRDMCSDLCIDFTFEGHPNNGPPPACKIAPCLQCDEVNSGPYFKRFAARTRRRSGLLSKIARPCDAILIVNHTEPCPAKSGDSPLKSIQTEPTCQDIKGDLGPLRYAETTSNIFFDISFLLSSDQRLQRSTYGTCARYRLRGYTTGFWNDISERLGAPWKTAAYFSIIVVCLGGVAVFLLWSTTCVAYRQNVWTAMAIAMALCGVLELLTLVFFAADVCPEGGCEFSDGAAAAIVSGILYLFSAVLAFKTRRPAREGRTIGCCCCPHWDIDYMLEVHPLLKEEESAADLVLLVEQGEQPTDEQEPAKTRAAEKSDDVPETFIGDLPLMESHDQG